MCLTHGTLHSLQTMNSSVITATLLAVLVIGSTMAGREYCYNYFARLLFVYICKVELYKPLYYSFDLIIEVELVFTLPLL